MSDAQKIIEMTSVQEHYDKHLGKIYTWMTGGIETATKRGEDELDEIGIDASGCKIAVDLGAGFGMHAIPLARRGIEVIAIDTCADLLDELQIQKGALPIQEIRDDILSFPRYLVNKPDLVLCMGDTLTHLADVESVNRLIISIADEIRLGGKFVVSLRDYSTPLIGEHRFIPVRSDNDRILTCFLEYTDSHVVVHDILYEREKTHWQQSVSKYNKIRISPDWLDNALKENGFLVNREPGLSGMIRFVARRV